MAKYPNPVRGYIHCPVCSEVSTVHQTGEGQLIATGEPPKNSRNIGLMYYRCPECGNSSISAKGHEYIQANMVTASSDLPTVTQTEIKPDLTEESSALEGVLLTEDNALSSVIDEIPEASHDNVSSVNETDESDTKSTVKPWLKQGLIILGLLVFIGWSIRQLMPKPKTPPVTENVTEGQAHG